MSDSPAFRCSHCGATVPEDAERCPKCLRRSGLLGSEPEPGELAAPASSGPSKGGRVARSVAALVAIGLLAAGFRAAVREVFMPGASTTLPPPPNVDLDPRGLEKVAIRSSRTLEMGELYGVNLTADAGDFERTLDKLRVHVVAVTVHELKKDQSANGAIHVFLPARYRTPEHEQRVEQDEKTIADALAKAHASTPKGDPIRVNFTFGELPDGR